MSVGTRLTRVVGLDDYVATPAKRRETLLGLVLIAPAVVLIGAVILYPIAYNVYLSFTTVPLNPDQAPTWVGLDNYVQLLSSGRFWSAFSTTLSFTVGATAVSTVAGLAVALLFDREFRRGRLDPLESAIDRAGRLLQARHRLGRLGFDVRDQSLDLAGAFL
jgi:ABC-type Fe3+ transport system permease subunit